MQNKCLEMLEWPLSQLLGRFIYVGQKLENFCGYEASCEQGKTERFAPLPF